MGERWSRFVAVESFATILARHRGVGTGFATIRLATATLIFAVHAKWICGAPGTTDVGLPARFVDPLTPVRLGAVRRVGLFHGPFRPIALAMVPTFFVLSGFLIAGSALRVRAVSTFVAHRMLRIVPALAATVLTCGFLIGPIYTVLPLRHYFVDGRFWRYLGNIAGRITYVLPGVFVGNPASGFVNASLWTIEAEGYVYLMLILLMVTKVLFSRRALAIVLLAALTLLADLHFVTGASTPVNGPFNTHVLLAFAAVGILLYRFADLVPYSYLLMTISVCASYFFLLFDSTVYLAVPSLAYMTVCFGLTLLPRLRVLGRGDYSYGVYLYGFPVSQALMASFPDAFLKRPLLFIPIAFLMTLGVAITSWTLLERHALACKRHLPKRWFPEGKLQRSSWTHAAASTSASRTVTGSRPSISRRASGTSTR